MVSFCFFEHHLQFHVELQCLRRFCCRSRRYCSSCAAPSASCTTADRVGRPEAGHRAMMDHVAPQHGLPRRFKPTDAPRSTNGAERPRREVGSCRRKSQRCSRNLAPPARTFPEGLPFRGRLPARPRPGSAIGVRLPSLTPPSLIRCPVRSSSTPSWAQAPRWIKRVVRANQIRRDRKTA